MKYKMINKLRFITVTLAFVSLLVSCASTPDFDMTQVDESLTPQSVITEPELSMGKTVLWGGTILNTQNLKDATHVEILAYPLNTYQRPLLDSKPLGRFIIHHKGYLEPATYAPGRELSVLGEVGESLSGQVGDSTYTYAVIKDERMHLWSKDGGRNKTSFHFGLGIGIGR